MWRDIGNYLRALWKHWLALAGGVGSLLLGAIGTRYSTPLPSWTFWLMSLACFLVAPFLAWQDGHKEIKRLLTPRYSAEQLQRVRALYGMMDQNERDLLREIRVRGFMLENQATEIYRRRGFVQGGTLHALENNTNLICKTQGDQYRFTSETQDALFKVMDES